MFTFRGGAGLRLSPYLVGAVALLGAAPLLAANVIFFSGNLRTDATVTDCGAACTLGAADSDSDYAQWAAVVDTFSVSSATSFEAITYSYGGGASLTGVSVASGGLEPYLSLFDSGGNFIDSTFFGVNCPAGANSVGGNCFDVAIEGDTLTPGTYSIVLTAFENLSHVENGTGTNLSDGFTGLGNLAGGENLNYAFDIVLPGNTPEPGTLEMLAIGSVALLLRKRLLSTR